MEEMFYEVRIGCDCNIHTEFINSKIKLTTIYDFNPINIPNIIRDIEIQTISRNLEKSTIKKLDLWKFYFSVSEIVLIKIGKNLFLLSPFGYLEFDRKTIKNIDDLFYRILHSVSKSLIYILDNYNSRLNELERNVFDHENTSLTIRQSYTIQKEINSFLFSIKKVQHAFDNFSKSNRFEIIKDIKEDVQDSIDICYDLLSRCESITQLSFSNLGQRTNDIMKFLTIATFITTPISIHLSFFGSNFKQLPFVNENHAVLYFTVFIIIQSIIIFWVLIRKGWIENKLLRVKFRRMDEETIKSVKRWIKMKLSYFKN